MSNEQLNLEIDESKTEQPESHNFYQSRAYSHDQSDEPYWEKIYRTAFPNFHSMVNLPKDGWWQRAGIDRVIQLTNSRQILIDEKIRKTNYEDFFLEYWSKKEKRLKGWIEKEQACDFIAYAFEPKQTCYLLPFPVLRAAWIENRKQWVRDYQNEAITTETSYETWTSVGVIVPISVVFDAMTDAMRIEWQK